MVSLPSRANRVVLVTGIGVGIAVEPEHPVTKANAANAAAATGRTVAASMVISRRVRMATPCRATQYGSVVHAAPHWPAPCRFPPARMDGRRVTVVEAAMVQRRGQQKGPQQHAEGQHGEKTHERF